MVSSTPDVTHFSRSAIFSGGYAILGSDGVFDVLKNEDLAEMVQMKINEGVDLAVICNQILDLCLAKVRLRIANALIVIVHYTRNI